MVGFLARSMVGRSQLLKALQAHFKDIELTDLVTAARDFPVTARVDVQAALQDVVAQRAVADGSSAFIRR